MKDKIRLEVMKALDQEAEIDTVVDNILLLFSVSNSLPKQNACTCWRCMGLGKDPYEDDSNLEMLLVGLFPENEIKVEVENDGKIVINIDDKKIKIKIQLPETDIFPRIIYPDMDFSMEYTQLIVDEIKNQLNLK